MNSPVLIVDDSQTLRFSMGKMLRKLGWESLEAENGEQCLALLRANPDITLAIIDYNMPGMNGVEVVAAIKALLPKRPLTCVIFTSIGTSNKELLAAAKQAGVAAWLSKPVQVGDLQQVLELANPLNISISASLES